MQLARGSDRVSRAVVDLVPTNGIGNRVSPYNRLLAVGKPVVQEKHPDAKYNAE